MAELFPFRGLSFDTGKAGPIDSLATQPYDKITPAMKQRYLAANPHNIVRVILPADPGSVDDTVYGKAARTFEEWIESGVILRDHAPAFYPYHQSYAVPGSGEVRTRRSFIGLGKLYDYSAKVIRPHEHTHSGPKVDRLKLTRATGCQFGQLFMLYPDPENTVNSLFDKSIEGREPMIRVRDEYGVSHEVWRVDNPATLEQVRELMRPRNLYIADGHHRYDTALTYWREKAAEGVRAEGNEAIDHAMMTFVCLEDPGLSVLPTHRVVFGLEGFDPRALLERLKAVFDLESLGEPTKVNLDSCLAGLSGTDRAFVIAARGLDSLWRASLKASRDPRELIPGEGSADWKGLDVNVLHKLIIEPHLGIDPKSLERADHISYIREPAEALEMAVGYGGTHQAAFFLNPTRVQQVVAVADHGEYMPQKSTDFYPKMLTGLLINKINL